MFTLRRLRRPGSIQVERWFAELTRKQLQRGVHHLDPPAISADIRAFIDKHNEDPKPFRWTKSADDILASASPQMPPPGRSIELNAHNFPFYTVL